MAGGNITATLLYLSLKKVISGNEKQFFLNSLLHENVNPGRNFASLNCQLSHENIFTQKYN